MRRLFCRRHGENLAIAVVYFKITYRVFLGGFHCGGFSFRHVSNAVRLFLSFNYKLLDFPNYFTQRERCASLRLCV